MNKAPEAFWVIRAPLLAPLLSLAGASIYAIYAAVRFSGDKLSNQYYYVVPIVIPFVAFTLDRLVGLRESTARQSLADALVVIVAMWRVIGDVPYVSGHALFLTYALLRARSRFAKVTAAVVMAEVIYLKVFVWHDWVTLLCGVALGSVAALVGRGRTGMESRQQMPATTI